MALKEIKYNFRQIAVEFALWVQKIRYELCLNRYYGINPDNEEIAEVMRFVQHNGIKVFPHPFIFKYNANTIDVFKDKNANMYYVETDDSKKLYFPRNMTKMQIRHYYNFLRMEQDIDSPHRYLYGDFGVGDEEIVADIGCAEGNFGLSVVEKVKKLYLFERSEKWIDALKFTFSPYMDKVEIIQKFVSDSDEKDNITLNSFFKDKKIDFIKLDTDGAEKRIMDAGAEILKRKRLKIALCIYHNQSDIDVLGAKMKEYGYSIEYSKGYMIFLYSFKVEKPYLRKVLIRGIKDYRYLQMC